MKKNFPLIALFLTMTTQVIARNTPEPAARSMSFIENKGQIRDQHGMPRNDIQFALPAGNMNIFIGNAQLHYQFSRLEPVSMTQPGTFFPDGTRNEKNFEANIHTYRLDVELVGANTAAMAVAGKQQAYYENHYFAGAPVAGIRAHAYNKITYRNVYPDIDWVIYVAGSKLEHEFVVGSKGDASQIKLRYKGQTSLRINEDGSVTATTPMGTITEKAPVCYGADGTPAKSSYKLNGDVLSYDLHGFKDAVLIDPELIWGTYYGPNTVNNPFYDVDAYDSASLYACGLTWSGDAGTIATTGAFLDVFGGFTDAFLVKFDTGGNRQWATYYGGVESDYGVAVDCDAAGNVYMGGVTSSISGISTPGSQQATYVGAPFDAFLVKFRPDGSRHWGTYLGSGGTNFPWGVATDLSGGIYISGDTNEGSGISTPASYQPAKSGGEDWYLVKYDTMGVREWGTYYGGPGREFNGVCATDGYVVYLAGGTRSTTGIVSSPFAHQATFGGDADAAVVKFFPTGTFSWSTYYGGSMYDAPGGIACDIFQNIYLFGQSNSDNNIATPTSFQPARAGGTDAFLVKFHPETGYRMWGTYIGGPGEETVEKSRIATDDSANIYVDGITESASGIASDTAWQTVYGGEVDGFLAKFNHIGIQKWCSYLGGARFDEPRGLSCLGQAVFVCGQTTSSDSIATPGAFLDFGGSTTFSNQAFLQKISDPDTSSIPEDTTTIPPVGVHTMAGAGNAQLTLFPNPNNGAFTLSGVFGTKTGIAEYSITDIAGRVVLRGKTATHAGDVSEQVAMADVPDGVYILKIEIPGGAVQTISFRKE